MHPAHELPSQPTLPTSSYTGFHCHPTTSYLVLHWLLLPSYPVLPYPSQSYLIQPHPTLYSTALLTSSYTGSFCDSTLYYLILPHLTTSYPVLLLSTPPYVVFYCHPTLDATPSYLSLIFFLPHLTTAYPVAPSYPILHCILLPAYLTSNPVLSASVVFGLTNSIVWSFAKATKYGVQIKVDQYVNLDVERDHEKIFKMLEYVMQGKWPQY